MIYRILLTYLLSSLTTVMAVDYGSLGYSEQPQPKLIGSIIVVTGQENIDHKNVPVVYLCPKLTNLELYALPDKDFVYLFKSLQCEAIKARRGLGPFANKQNIFSQAEYLMVYVGTPERLKPENISDEQKLQYNIACGVTRLMILKLMLAGYHLLNHNSFKLDMNVDYFRLALKL